MKYTVMANVSMRVVLSVENADSREEAEKRALEDLDVSLEDIQILDIISVEVDEG